MILIPGEKKKRKELQEKLGRKLTKKEAIKLHKKLKRRLIVTSILAGAGITAVAGTKLLPEPKSDNIVKIEQEKNNSFKEGLKVDEKDLNKKENTIDEKSDIEKAVEQFENSEDVLNFLKDMYIEQYEQQTGDETLTTEDITITDSTESYVYIDENTGNYIAHNSKPAETEAKYGNSFSENNIKDGVKVYKVQTKSGETLDCISIQTIDGKNAPVKVIKGNLDANYESVLQDMSNIIDKGIKLCTNFDDEKTKEDFIKALEEEEQKQVENDGMEIGDY